MTNALFGTRTESPIGQLLVAGTDAGICRICFPSELSGDWCPWFNRHFSALPKEEPHPVVHAALKELERYFAGELRDFTVPLDLRGTDFQIKAWTELRKVPYGQTTSYGELARQVGRPLGARAIGAAMGRNPIPIIVPCHRVIGHNAALVGFGGGLSVKQKLLSLENAQKSLLR